MRSIGEAIFNADADDFLEPNAIELLANKFKIEEADVVIGNSYQVLNGKKRVVRNKIPLQQNKTAMCARPAVASRPRAPLCSDRPVKNHKTGGSFEMFFDCLQFSFPDSGAQAPQC